MRRLAPLVLSFLVAAAGAQQPIDVMQADLSELKRKVAELEKDAQSEATFRFSQAEGMAELLSRQLAQNAPTKDSAAAWVEAADNVPKELKDAANDAAFLAHAPADVRALAKGCVLAAADAKVSATDNQQFSLAGCTSAQQQQLKSKLLELESRAKNTFDRCRRVVTDTSPEYQDVVPQNPYDVDDKLLKALATYPDAAVRDCASSIEEAKQSLAEIKDAKALLSNAMMMAANVCFASGGNPYVCGGMLALAILMEIFDGSGGGGNGEGKGEGPKEGGAGGSQQAPTIQGGPAKESEEGKAAREAQAAEAVKRGPASNLGSAPGLAAGNGNLDSENAKTNISCNGGAGRIRCAVINAPGSERYFYGHPAITSLASSPVNGTLTVCAVEIDKKLEIAGIALKEGNVYHAFAHNSTKGTQDIGGKYASFEEACKRVK